MEISQRVKHNLVRAFVVFAGLAVALNVLAAAESFGSDQWSAGFGYLLIASALAAALALHWHVANRQTPYRFRDESWGQERWRELGYGGADARDDDGEDPDDGYGRG